MKNNSCSSPPYTRFSCTPISCELAPSFFPVAHIINLGLIFSTYLNSEWIPKKFSSLSNFSRFAGILSLGLLKFLLWWRRPPPNHSQLGTEALGTTVQEESCPAVKRAWKWFRPRWTPRWLQPQWTPWLQHSEKPWSRKPSKAAPGSLTRGHWAMISVCCFKPLSFGVIYYAAINNSCTQYNT